MSDKEPENYSLDEMMKRLRSRGEGGDGADPQLVTREDGQQVMRVRKRKRRTKQPHKEEESRRRRKTLGFAAVVTVLILALGLGIIGGILYLNSSSYRNQVTARLNEWTGAETSLVGFRTTPVSVSAGKVEFVWPEDSVASKLVLNGVRGDLMLTSHLSNDWSGDQLMASNGGELTLRSVAGEASSEWKMPAGKCPFRFNFRAPKFRVKFGDGASPALVVSDADASLVIPDPAQAVASVVIENGRTRLGDWGVFRVHFGSVKLGNGEVRLGNLQLRPEASPEAEIRLIGEEMPALNTRGGESEMRVRFTEVPSADLLGQGLGTLIEGVFESPGEEQNTGRCFVDFSELASLRVEAPIRTGLSAGVSLKGLGLFEELGQAMNSEGVSRPSFESEARAKLLRDERSTRLEEIEFVAQGVARVRGNLQARQGGELSGVLVIGLPEATILASESGAVKRLFSRRDLGHMWAEVEISGTTAKPSHNLLKLLAEARQSVPPATDGVKGLDEEFENLTTPGGGR